MHTLLRKGISSRELASWILVNERPGPVHCENKVGSWFAWEKIAQRSQYLMPIYANSSKTNCEYKVKHLVGDVSQRSSGV